MSQLISDMGGDFDGELVSPWKPMASANKSRHSVTERNCERNGKIGKAAARKAMRKISWKCEGSLNSSGDSLAQWVIGRGCKLPSGREAKRTKSFA